MRPQSPYDILGIPGGATEKQIRKAYRRLAMKYHPDRNPENPLAEEEFKRIQWAYEELLRAGKVREKRDGVIYTNESNTPFQNSDHPFLSFYASLKTSLLKNKKKIESSK